MGHKPQFDARYQQNVPRLLREIREEAGLTQRQLSDALGVEQSWVSRSENASGLRRIDVSEFARIAIACSIDPAVAYARFLKMAYPGGTTNSPSEKMTKDELAILSATTKVRRLRRMAAKK